jgi:hypothetical protein
VSASTLIARGRAAAIALMQDTCTITRRATSSTDPETGVVTATYTTVYPVSGTGICKIQQAAPATNPTDVGEAAVFVGQLVLHLPVTDATAAVQPDDVVEIVTCVHDASLVGKTFKLRGPSHKSYATARRFPMTEVSG